MSCFLCKDANMSLPSMVSTKQKSVSPIRLKSTLLFKFQMIISNFEYFKY